MADQKAIPRLMSETELIKELEMKLQESREQFGRAEVQVDDLENQLIVKLSELKAAEARNEALLQALKKLLPPMKNWLTDVQEYAPDGWQALADDIAEAEAAMDSGSASQEAKTPGGENA